MTAARVFSLVYNIADAETATDVRTDNRATNAGCQSD